MKNKTTYLKNMSVAQLERPEVACSLSTGSFAFFLS